MTGSFLIVAILVAAVLVWLKRQKGARSVMFETSGLSYFKVLLRQRGVDLSKIPDAALFDIIRAKIAAAKTQATVAGMTDSGRGRKNWRINLVRSLEAETKLIVALLADGGAEGHRTSDAAIALTKHGVLKPKKLAGQSGMTPEQFLEATRRGTLYSELRERRANRETS